MAQIRQLDPIVASRIAAGEVVERPASVLRELLDNAIDAKATRISVYMEEGGSRNLTVIDNGVGMSQEDLLLACESHATSKVRTLEDLFNLKTLGFRGEALSSISSCSRLTINSNGYRIVVDNGKKGNVTPGAIDKGTSVSMEFLFENIPARKLFLKRPQSEASECKKVFLEKALGFEDIDFQLFTENTLAINLPKTDKKGRCIQVMSLDKSFTSTEVLQMTYEGENLNLIAICSTPEVYKRDRSQIRVFVNNRIIDSYAFTTAINNAYSASLPGGAFPFFYLFIEDEPALVDFNVHPSKRECKLRNQSHIYAAITTMIRDALTKKPKAEETAKEETTKEEAKKEETKYIKSKEEILINNTLFDSPAKHKEETYERPKAKPFDSSWFDNAKAIMAKKQEAKPEAKTESKKESNINYTYLGQVFDTFLLVQKDNELLFIDQHALHERLLYDQILSLKDVQRLIVPYEFETEPHVDSFLKENSVLYSDFGIELTRKDNMLWEMASLPAAARKSESQIVQYIQNSTGDIEEIQKGLFAIIACHSAIKAGDKLDDITAKSLVKKAFELENMTCPHGRSFTYSIDKIELFKNVGRIV